MQPDQARLLDAAGLALRRAGLGVVLAVNAAHLVDRRWVLEFKDISGTVMHVPVPWHRGTPLQTTAFLERELPKRFAQIRGLCAFVPLLLTVLPMA